MIRRTSVAVLIVGALFASCSDSEDSDSIVPDITLFPPTSAPPVDSSPESTVESTTTTSSSTTLPPTETTEVDPIIEELVLSDEGIGTAGFGADADGTIDYVASYLGAPDNDTGWIDPLTIGLCSGDELRRVSWGVLTLLFGDVSDVVQGRRHFFGYTYGDRSEVGAAPVGLQTTEGIMIGSRVVDVTAAYPGVTVYPEDDFTPPFFYVNDSLRGYLTGVDDDAVVTAILGGEDCGI